MSIESFQALREAQGLHERILKHQKAIEAHQGRITHYESLRADKKEELEKERSFS